jgi:sarcosine oxidase
MSRAVVVGGGLMGSAAAWRLAARGVDVTVLEQFTARHDRGASHGSSRVIRLTYPERAYTKMGAEALGLWRALESKTATSLLTMTGTVDHGPESVTTALAAVLADLGLTGRQYTPAEAHQRWPQLRFDTTVLFHEDAGKIHADNAVQALQQAAVAHGANIRFGSRVQQISERAECVHVLLDGGEVIEADFGVVSAGAWLPQLIGPILPLPMLRVTQELPVHFPARDGMTGWPSFIHHAGASIPETRYGLSSPDGVKVAAHAVGPEVDPDHRDRSINSRMLDDIVQYASEWVPGVDPTQPEATTCLYTMTPDEDFIVDRVGSIAVLGGFSGHGFKFGPAIGELAATMLLDGQAAPELFSIRRPALVS